MYYKELLTVTDTNEIYLDDASSESRSTLHAGSSDAAWRLALL